MKASTKPGMRARASLNERLAAGDLPVRVANMSSIWTRLLHQPSRYNWMFQYYLRLEHLALSWIGTGRLIFSLNYTDEDFAAVADHFVAAAEKMKHDGWWWRDAAAHQQGHPPADSEGDDCATAAAASGRDRRRIATAGPHACLWTGVCSRMSRPGSISSPRIRNSGDFQ